jgi:hypothetical protein
MKKPPYANELFWVLPHLSFIIKMRKGIVKGSFEKSEFFPPFQPFLVYGGFSAHLPAALITAIRDYAPRYALALNAGFRAAEVSELLELSRHAKKADHEITVCFSVLAIALHNS